MNWEGTAISQVSVIFPGRFRWSAVTCWCCTGSLWPVSGPFSFSWNFILFCFACDAPHFLLSFSFLSWLFLCFQACDRTALSWSHHLISIHSLTLPLRRPCPGSEFSVPDTYSHVPHSRLQCWPLLRALHPIQWPTEHLCLKNNHRGSCCDLCLRVFCLCSPLGVL